MTKKLRLTGVVLLVVAGVIMTVAAAAGSPKLPEPVLINDDGGWCWYQDERAIWSGGRLIVGSVASGRHNLMRRGNIEVSSLDPKTGEVSRFVLHKRLELDDHDSPALLTLPDGRILAVYSKHCHDRYIRYRSTLRPGDISLWLGEDIYEINKGVHGASYSNVYRLSAENGRIYDLFRGSNYNPSAIVSDNNGESWRLAGQLLTGPGRPYVRYTSNGVDTIHFVTTEQHPRDYDNSLYHGYIKGGVIHDSFGNEIGKLGEKAVEPTELTRFFQGDQDNVAWGSDMTLGPDGRLYVVYSVQKDGSCLPKGKGGFDHRYRYAWFDGTVWHDHEIGHAGSRLYAGEDDYTGLVSLHPQSPDTVYFSTNADPVTGYPLISMADDKRHYEIFKGTTQDGGETWAFTPITRDSTRDQLRPKVPEGGPEGSALIWLRGKYKSYSNYDLDMVALIPAP